MTAAQRQITVCAILLAGALALLTSSAHAATRHHKPRCKTGYILKHRTIRRHHHKVKISVCVRQRPSRPAPKLGAPAGVTAPRESAPEALHAHLDPSFVRDHTDPLHVTYTYSASATTSTPAPLPEGVLSLYSDGLLKCSMNVGAAITGGECSTHYQATGEHQVVVTYQSGAVSATETTVENIAPFTTTTSLTIAYTPLEHAANEPYGAPVCLETGFSNGKTVCERYTTESHVWKIGTLAITASTTDEYANNLNTGLVAPIINSQLDQAATNGSTSSVYACTADEGPGAHEVTGIAVGDSGISEEATRTCPLAVADIAAGKYTATGSFAGITGWAASTVTQPIVFTPTLDH